MSLHESIECDGTIGQYWLEFTATKTKARSIPAASSVVWNTVIQTTWHIAMRLKKEHNAFITKGPDTICFSQFILREFKASCSKMWISKMKAGISVHRVSSTSSTWQIKSREAWDGFLGESRFLGHKATDVIEHKHNKRLWEKGMKAVNK